MDVPHIKHYRKGDTIIGLLAKEPWTVQTDREIDSLLYSEKAVHRICFFFF